MKMWPTCDKKGLKQHQKEYEFRLDCYVTCPEATPDETATVFDYEKDRLINIESHWYRIKVLENLIAVCKQELKDFDSSS